VKIIYPTLQHARDAHAKVLELSGGLSGELNAGQLESILTNIQNDDYYPTFVDKLTHLCHSLCKFHCFNDGNKRTALAVTVQMLEWNDCDYCVPSFIREMENIIVAVAENRVGKALLSSIIAAHVNQSYADDEALKLDVLEALTRPLS
jgi:death on curing protein